PTHFAPPLFGAFGGLQLRYQPPPPPCLGQPAPNRLLPAPEPLHRGAGTLEPLNATGSCRFLHQIQHNKLSSKHQVSFPSSSTFRTPPHDPHPRLYRRPLRRGAATGCVHPHRLADAEGPRRGLPTCHPQVRTSRPRGRNFPHKSVAPPRSIHTRSQTSSNKGGGRVSKKN
ncbi:unnamed protein product, partial [Ixodes persulcatus]